MNQEAENKITAIIGQLRDELKSIYPDFRGIYFFGSRARGDYNEDSDVDLVLVFDRLIDNPLKKKLNKYLYNIELANDLTIDSKIYNHNDILNPFTPFRENVYREGLFYAV